MFVKERDYTNIKHSFDIWHGCKKSGRENHPGSLAL